MQIPFKSYSHFLNPSRVCGFGVLVFYLESRNPVISEGCYNDTFCFLSDTHFPCSRFLMAVRTHLCFSLIWILSFKVGK